MPASLRRAPSVSRAVSKHRVAPPPWHVKGVLPANLRRPTQRRARLARLANSKSGQPPSNTNANSAKQGRASKAQVPLALLAPMENTKCVTTRCRRSVPFALQAKLFQIRNQSARLATRDCTKNKVMLLPSHASLAATGLRRRTAPPRAANALPGKLRSRPRPTAARHAERGSLPPAIRRRVPFVLVGGQTRPIRQTSILP